MNINAKIPDKTLANQISPNIINTHTHTNEQTSEFIQE